MSMATSTIKESHDNNIIPVSSIASIDGYTNAKLLQALRDSNEIISGKLHAFSVMATGGARVGLCYLYGNTKQYGWIMVGHYNYMPIFLTVNDGVAIENPFTADRHIMHDFNVTIAAADSANGQKTFDITIPSGYRLASSKIYGSYVSGNVSVKANDKSAVLIRDGVVRLSVFLYNPNNISANLAFAGAVYLEKVA